MHNSPKSYSHLQPEDRVTLASLKQQNYSVRAMARVLGRPASTISRELRRNATGGQYGSAAAQQACLQRRRQARPCAKLQRDTLLFDVVQYLLRQRWSPEQIALTMARIYPKENEYRVSQKPSTTASMPSRWSNCARN